MKSLNFAITVLILIILSMIPVSYIVREKPKIVDDRYSAIIRIINPQYARTSCSAFVISDKIAITAEHCVDDAFMRIVYFTDQYHTELLQAQVFSSFKTIDQAMLVGDFSKFKRFNLKFPSNGIAGNKGPFKTCGYAYGGKLMCFDYTPIGIDDFMLAGKGFLYSGMSGGPLFDVKTNEVVGVNVAVKENIVIHSPLVNTLEKHGVIPE
jgi:hypothetical protein